MTQQRIGLLGGSFNPPHLAHLALARAAQVQLGLDRVDLMPAGQPWQKAGTDLAPAAQRLAMCQAAVAGISKLGVEPCETQRTGNTYTVDTLRHLLTLNPTTHYTLIVGADQAKRLDTWHDWRELLHLCRLAVVARNGAAPLLPDAVAVVCRAFDTLHLAPMAVSSSAIRQRVALGLAISDCVPSAVERYIVTYSLYRNTIAP